MQIKKCNKKKIILSHRVEEVQLKAKLYNKKVLN